VFVEHAGFGDQGFKDGGVRGAEIILGIVIEKIRRLLGEGKGRDIDDRPPDQSAEVPPMGLLVILQEIRARKDVVVDKQDVGALGLLDAVISSGRGSLTVSVKDPQAIAHLQFFQHLSGIVTRTVVDHQDFEFGTGIAEQLQMGEGLDQDLGSVSGGNDKAEHRGEHGL